MRASTYFFLMAVAAVGCGGGSGSASTSGATTAKAAAEALTTGLTIKNGTLKAGGIAAATASMVMLTQTDPPISLAPGGGALMTLDADNPDESSDPVESTLMQFQDSDSHFEVPRSSGNADGGTGAQGVAHLEADMSVDKTACDNLCNKKFQLKMMQAVVLHSGKVSKQLMRDVELDCSKDGSASKCGGSTSSGTKDAGKAATGTSGTSGGSKDAGTSSSSAAMKAATYAGEVTSSIAAFDTTACACGTAPDKMTSKTYCSTAPYPMSVVTCIQSAIMASTDPNLSTDASCAKLAFDSVAMSCSSGCTCTAAAINAAMQSMNCVTIAGTEACIPKSASDAGARPADGGH
ncbi:MAG: hypothetical protein ACHQ53_12125 [Polyangiales bacterium]